MGTLGILGDYRRPFYRFMCSLLAVVLAVALVPAVAPVRQAAAADDVATSFDYEPGTYAQG